MTNCIAIIPAKGTSSRIPRKNIRMFHGKPIIAYSIETARASGLFGRIVVSTDDHEIALIAVKYGAEFIERPAELSLDTVGTQEVAADALRHMPSYDYACCIYATAPLMRIEDLARGLNLLTDATNRPRAQFAFSCDINTGRDAGQFYWGKVGAFLGGRELFDCDTIMCGIPTRLVCDINDESDWSRAEATYAALHR